ncbi:minor histocompatibility antigen H13-like [Antedon mediterranea]|uniref:minor histocompatibility antigen H13-like n=1 Tax=Antedon mediterranea TaxID=105859 RepID=UPI003AF542F7
MANSEADVSMENATLNETLANATGRIPSTPEGMAVAYSSLLIMALLPIFVGSFRSVKFLKDRKLNGEAVETMSSKDAAMFPVYASAALFGIYLVFKFFSKEYINLLLTFYFFCLGVLAIAHILSPIVHKLPDIFTNVPYHMIFTQGEGEQKEEIVNQEFDRKDLLALVVSAGFGIWYLVQKHWIANNVFGLAFSVNAVEFLQLNTVITGCILLGGLFFYDIFWVFGTDVMVTVAKSFEAPIKLVFPQDLLENGLAANNFAMLGLGDIVIPGIFIALLLRFDVSKKTNSHLYFYCGFFAYISGLVTTIGVMHFYKHAQPALLYLVPMCIGFPLFVALIRGEIKDILKYEDSPEGTKHEADNEESIKEESDEKKSK